MGPGARGAGAEFLATPGGCSDLSGLLGGPALAEVCLTRAGVQPSPEQPPEAAVSGWVWDGVRVLGVLEFLAHTSHLPAGAFEPITPPS